MRPYLLVPGVLIALAGLTFILQGLGMVGPQSSFMYRSTNWVVDGIGVLVVGLLVVAAGTWLGRAKRI